MFQTKERAARRAPDGQGSTSLASPATTHGHSTKLSSKGQILRMRKRGRDCIIAKLVEPEMLVELLEPIERLYSNGISKGEIEGGDLTGEGNVGIMDGVGVATHGNGKGDKGMKRIITKEARQQAAPNGACQPWNSFISRVVCCRASFICIGGECDRANIGRATPLPDDRADPAPNRPDRRGPSRNGIR